MINHNNRTVLQSIQTDDKLRCVDIYRDSDGMVYWGEWRRDLEDLTQWYATGRRSRVGYKNERLALLAALDSIVWLQQIVSH